jgi:hypothetical protein
MHSFIFYDQLIDEFRYTQRFSVQNALKKLKPNQHFRHNFAITRDQYVFCYTVPLISFQIQNDIRLDQMESMLKGMMTVGKITKRPIIYDQMDVNEKRNE